MVNENLLKFYYSIFILNLSKGATNNKVSMLNFGSFTISPGSQCSSIDSYLLSSVCFFLSVKSCVLI